MKIQSIPSERPRGIGRQNLETGQEYQGENSMSRLKNILIVASVLLVAAIPLIADGQPATTPATPSTAAPAATPATSTANTVKGTMKIAFDSRVQLDESGKPKAGVKDVYTLDLQAVDTAIFQGTIEYLPTILSSVLGRETQQGLLTYNLNLLVANPANLTQRRAVGKLTGGVQIDSKGVYLYDKGTLRIAVDAAGTASGFESKFSGAAVGKPPKNTSSLAAAKKQAQTLTRQVQGKTVKLVVTDYDIMTLNSLVLAAGPVRTYPETTVNGEMLYDYERSAWYFRGLTMTYIVDGKAVTDKITGNIKWVESPQRKTNGEGEYQFDVRCNEPEQKSGETAVFQPVDDEAAFFAVDKTLPSLTGTAKYKDTMRGETVASSAVTIDLTSNLNKQQVINLTKLIWLVAVVPVNAE
jgi:hypothetical protein